MGQKKDPTEIAYESWKITIAPAMESTAITNQDEAKGPPPGS